MFAQAAHNPKIAALKRNSKYTVHFFCLDANETNPRKDQEQMMYAHLFCSLMLLLCYCNPVLQYFYCEFPD